VLSFFTLIALLLLAVVSFVPLQAYAHGCQAQGGCCTVGDPCVEISANTPLGIMFVAVSIFGALLLPFYGREQRRRLYSALNIFE
jgi:hypothetical protein